VHRAPEGAPLEAGRLKLEGLAQKMLAPPVVEGVLGNA